jgi:hypothetical protein
LLDPAFLDVINGLGGGTEDPSFVAGNGTIIANDGSAGTPDAISNGIINQSTTDVVLQAQKTLSVDADIALAFGPNQTLVLAAGGTLTIAPGVGVSAPGNVTLTHPFFWAPLALIGEGGVTSRAARTAMR